MPGDDPYAMILFMANTYSTKLFSHNAMMKSFVAEASDLPGFSPSEWIGLTSHKTGQMLTFEPAGVERTNDGDNEIRCWNFRIRRSHAESNRALRGYTITVLND